MNEIHKLAIYSQAVEKWGKANQMDMCVEECAELIQAINKLKRNCTRESITNICGEIADVEIMLEQMRYILQNPLIDEIKEAKLKRLEQRIISSK